MKQIHVFPLFLAILMSLLGTITLALSTGDTEAIVATPMQLTIATSSYDLIRISQQAEFALGSRITSIDWSSNGESLAVGTSASGQSQGGIWLYNTSGGGASKFSDEPAEAVLFHPNGETLIACHNDTLSIWSIEQRRQVASIHTLDGGSPSSWITSCTINSDGQYVALSTSAMMVYVYDLSNATPVRSVNGVTNLDMTGGGGDTLGHVAFHPSKQIIAFGHGSGEKPYVYLWDFETDSLPIRLEPTGPSQAYIDAFVEDVSFNVDGSLLASVSWEKSIRIWNTLTFQEIRFIHDETKSSRAVTFSPDSELVVTAGSDDITFREVDTGNILHELYTPDGYILAIQFNPDGSMIASGGESGILRLWKIPRTD